MITPFLIENFIAREVGALKSFAIKNFNPHGDIILFGVCRHSSMCGYFVLGTDLWFWNNSSFYISGNTGFGNSNHDCIGEAIKNSEYSIEKFMPALEYLVLL